MAAVRCNILLLAPSSHPQLSKIARRNLTRCVFENNNVSSSSSSNQVDEWDVSRSCVNPVFRAPVCQEPTENTSRVKIVFASEGNVCRSVIAETIFGFLLQQSDLDNVVECSSKATKDFNVGEPPDPKAVEIVEKHGLKVPEGAVSRLFNFTKEIVESDLIVVMDKFDASDIMKQIVLQEVVDKRTVYSHKVRRLGDFCKSRVVDDIDDPLYGNMGGPEEIELLEQVYEDIEDSCKGLVQHLLSVKTNLKESETLRDGLRGYTQSLGTMDWLVPPMLQR